MNKFNKNMTSILKPTKYCEKIKQREKYTNFTYKKINIKMTILSKLIKRPNVIPIIT